MLRLTRHVGILVLMAVLAAEPLLAQSHFYFGRNKVQYEDFDWHILRTAHFDIYYDADAAELASIGAAEAEATYATLVHRFGIELPQRVPMVFYATNLHFRQTNVIPGFIPPGVGGFFEFMKGRVVIPADGDVHQFRRVIRHELVHVFTFTRLGQVNREHRRPAQGLPPLWFTEGLAEYWSGAPDHRYEMVMRDAVASNLLVRLEDLHRLGGYLVYKQGESVCRFIAEAYGEDRLGLLIENIWRDSDFRRVMEHVLGDDFRTIAERYDRWVRDHYLPRLRSAEAPGWIASAVSETAFAGKPVMVQRPDGSDAVLFVGNERGHTNLYTASLDHDGRVGDFKVLVRGERGPRFEAFHALESRLDVSPSGLVAFVTQSGPSDVIHVLDALDGEVRGTHRPDGMVAVYSPTWSPDEARLTFAGIDHGGFANLHLIDLRDGSYQRLTDDRYDVRDPHWSPCGRWVVFSSDRGPDGANGAYNLFALDLNDGGMVQLTFGDQRDASPRWTPGGDGIIFTSARRGPDGAFGGQDVYLIEPALEGGGATVEYRLTRLTSAAFDPHLAEDGRLVFGSYERGRFTIRLAEPEAAREIAFTLPPTRFEATAAWAHARYDDGTAERDAGLAYRRSYSLDVAQGGVATNPVFGTTGGGALALSDLLGDDRILVTAFVADVADRSLLDGLNFGISRVNLARRANVGYGLFRLSGLRFDRTDPDAHAGYPVFFEQLTGGYAALSYPLSRFQRVEVSALLAWNNKEIPAGGDREAMLLAPSVTLTHDNALYGPNGPVEGWKAQLTAGASTDVLYDNVRYYSLSADVRHYLRLGRHVSFASWGMARTHVGREARLWLLGGSWDLRGFPFLRVRGHNQLFTSHELRFSIAEAPSAHLPLLAPFGISNVRGALYVDAARAWNEDFHRHEPQLLTGRTLGALGGGLRVNLFGGLVLRYDLGYRFENGFVWDDRRPFRQFFFGYDF